MTWRMVLAVASFMLLGTGVAMAEDDPFANVKGGEAAVASPDGSSSVRAKKKAVPEMFQGVVESVKKNDAAFPRVVTVTIKIQKEPAAKAAPHTEIKKSKSYEFVVSYKEKDGKLDVSDENTRQNVGVFFLEAKDRVEGIVKEKKGDVYVLEVLQRK